jgi:signal transduction histidine kinase
MNPLHGYKAPDKKGLRRFALITGAIFLLFSAIPFLRHKPVPHWPYYIAGFLYFFGLLAPSLLAPVHRYWMLAGGLLGWVNQRIILTIVFFVVLTPLAMLMRLVGKDSLGKKFDRAGQSYRIGSVAMAHERYKEPF